MEVNILDTADKGEGTGVSHAAMERCQRKKRDYVGKIPKRRAPPPPPQFGKPLLSKKKVGFIFHFRTSGTFLVFTKKSPFWVID